MPVNTLSLLALSHDPVVSGTGSAQCCDPRFDGRFSVLHALHEQFGFLSAATHGFGPAMIKLANSCSFISRGHFIISSVVSKLQRRLYKGIWVNIIRFHPIFTKSLIGVKPD